jgi:hypothetical protein
VAARASALARDHRFPWADWPKERLLDLRICDLGVTIAGTWLDRPLRYIHRELDRVNLRLRPHTWFSNEWFVPDGVPGIAIPFYLAHPTLMRLERSQMLEVEGGTLASAVKILRHEVGHALQQGYQLHHRRRWQQLFGKSSVRYPTFYRPNPASKDYVLHLDLWYAQSHPDEDFAETFAVWFHLAPQVWRKRYEGWPALEKLEYVDALMREIARRRPVISRRDEVDGADRLTVTLREFYAEKRARFGVSHPDIYDRDLKRLFSDAPQHRENEWAAAFLRRNRGEVRRLVARWTGEYQYTLQQVLKDMIGRCRELKLRRVGAERKVLLDFAILLTVKTMHYLYSGRHTHPL